MLSERHKEQLHTGPMHGHACWLWPRHDHGDEHGSFTHASHDSARRHVPNSGGRRRGAGGDGLESHHAGRLRELFHMYIWLSSRVAVIPSRAAMRSHASVNAIWRANTVCHSAPQMRERVPPADIDLPQTHAMSPS